MYPYIALEEVASDILMNNPSPKLYNENTSYVDRSPSENFRFARRSISSAWGRNRAKENERAGHSMLKVHLAGHKLA